jgi:two-component system, chemotaxis family, protein-glutamate methylesterase/glutaminase
MTRWIGARTAVPVRLASHGQPLEPGIWFAPDDRHLTVDRSMRLALRSGDGAVHRPSVDVLFSSLAEAAGRDVVAAVLTGMGRDGAEGVRAIRAAGGFVVVQDQQSSAVFGMPRAAKDAGANAVLPLAEIGSALGSLRLPETGR